MLVPSEILNRAMEIYLHEAYPAGVPAAIQQRRDVLNVDPGTTYVDLGRLERDATGAATGGEGCYVVRLGQPTYPHMKLVLDPAPAGHTCSGHDFLLRVDAHDRHLHAKAGSPDEAWLAGIRQSNQALVEKIEGAWAAAGLPTFKEFLRRQLEERRKAKGSP